VSFQDHPQADRFLAALRDGGWRAGEELPFHDPGCYGCGPSNPAGFGLRAVATEGEAVRAELTFDARFRGAPGLAHGGAIAGAFDDLFGLVLVRVLVPAVTVDLAVSYRRPVHLEVPCDLRAEVVDRDGRDLHLAGTLDQDGERKVAASGRFRLIEPERMLNRYERIERG
jgi:acyl-coenzyme A thioesterase PaaI-like protein